MSAPPPALRRTLGLTDAVVIGLGSMVGAGVFSVFAPAAAAAGAALMVGIVVAAAVAFANATASAQLAAQYPTSGGTYVYGRERLGPWWGFGAGWGFVVGKIASCAAMALTFSAYVAPPAAQRPVALLVVWTVVAMNLRGVSRTARLARVVVTIAVASLVAVAVASGLGGGGAFGPAEWSDLAHGGLRGILQAAALSFFAFAGYARIATLGEEVRDPARVIPRAIVTSLAITVVLYLVMGAVTLSVLGPAALARSSAPIADVAGRVAGPWLAFAVTVGAAAAAVGALLALLAGVGRTTLAMAREGDLPPWLAAVHPRTRVPHRAEVVVGAAVSVLVLTVDLRGALGFSAFGVLFYYVVANLAALTQDGGARRYPRALQVFGVMSCLALVASLPVSSLAAGAVVFAVGAVWRMGTRGFGDRAR